ncbi:MAG: CoA-binding protein [Desulfovibrionaceae bacterium]|nr:CoA-binding protein [Desulfovibrionaceae bacterium]
MLFNDKELIALLASVKTIAVVGAVDKPGRPVDTVARALIRAGYRVLPVHPKRKNVWGLETFESLTAIGEPVDLVDLFRASEHCAGHARECLAMSHLPKIFWMQEGVASPEARRILQGRPVTVVQNRCLWVEIKRLGIGAPQ